MHVLLKLMARCGHGEETTTINWGMEQQQIDRPPEQLLVV
jgi:hypothetical protein